MGKTSLNMTGFSLREEYLARTPSGGGGFGNERPVWFENEPSSLSISSNYCSHIGTGQKNSTGLSIVEESMLVTLEGGNPRPIRFRLRR